MAGAAGPNTAESGLVFAYDTGNIITSYIGEPTTNIAYATNNNLNSGGNWWVNGGANIFDDNDTSIPKPSIPNVDTSNLRIFSSLVTAGGSNQQLGSSIITISPSTTYSFSIWYYFTGNSMVIYPYIRTAVNNDAIGVFSYNGNTDGTTWPKNQWILLKATGTTQANETGIYMSSYTGTAVGDKVYYFGYQVEQKGHCTPLVLGTRSATQGLLNLGGTDTINITNASFNNNAQLIFDGTNDYVYLTSFNPTFTTGITMECVAKWTANPGGSWQRMFDFGNGSNADNLIFCRYSNGDQLFFGIYNGSGNSYNTTGTGAILFGQYAHYVAVADGTDFKVYVNGQLIFSGANSTIPVTTSRTNNYIGKSNWADSYFDGEIPVAKMYTKALTAAEVQQNYQALRYRFGI